MGILNENLVRSDSNIRKYQPFMEAIAQSANNKGKRVANETLSNTAKVMNNISEALDKYSKTRSYYNGLNEATNYGDVSGLKQFFLPVTTVAMPNLIAEDRKSA